MSLVSVFLPTYSRLYDGHLERAIQSVLAQTYANWELLILDDASVDGSRALIERYVRADRRIRTIRMDRNVGLPAKLIGLAYPKARGEYMAFIFDDCRWLPGHLATLVRMLQSGPGYGMVYGQAELIWPDGRRQTLGEPFNAAAMAAGSNHIPNVSVLVRRQAIETVGLYDPHFLMCRSCDWDLWLRISRKFPLGFVPKVVAEERGTSLPDSIGHSLTHFADLMLKYAARDRDRLLLPAVFHNYDPYSMDFERELNAEEKRRFRFVLLEHLAKSMDIPAIVDHVRLQLADPNGATSRARWAKIEAKNGGSDLDMLLLMQGLLDFVEQKCALLDAEVRRLRDFVQYQRRVIDEKQHYINDQQKFIDSRERYIQELIAYIATLQR